MEIKVTKLKQEARLPEYATDGAGCFDLCANLETNPVGFPVLQGNPVTVPTGLAFEIPEGHVMLIFSRSGHGFNSNTRLANCVGVIDSDYRGEVMVRLSCDSNSGKTLYITHGDRIAQGLILPIPKIKFAEVAALSETIRGEGGFGSTGA